MNISKKLQKGFTIIELIVVIAIIAVLAAIVLVNVTQYISKAKDASIEGNLATIQTNAAVYYDANSNYTGFLSASGYTVPQASIEASNAANAALVSNVSSAGDHFCSCSVLKAVSGHTYCVDDSGYKKDTTTACATRCPTTGVCGD